MKKYTGLITIFIALILLAGCNTENDGIFMRISKSETKKDVGTITLIAKKGANIYTQTKQHQLQVYNTAIKDWANLAPDKRATHVATDGTNIYFAPSVTEGENNSIFQYVIGNNSADPLAKYANKYMIVAMSPTADLMVVKNSSNKFDVHEISTEVKLISNLSFHETFTPQLIVQDSTKFIISGKSSATEYTHYLYNGITLLATITGINAPVVAFYNDTDTTNIVLLTSSGEIWHGTVAGGYAFTNKKGTVSNFSAGTPSHMPYPVFFHGGKLYLQDKNNYLHSITLATGTVAEEKTIDLSAVKVWSYLVDSDLVDSDKVYVGTTQNGIFEINMTTNKVTSL